MKPSRIIICFIFLFAVRAFAQSDYAVLVQENPVGAGEIKPGIGVHTFNVNEVVTLTTVARPGWKFVYWLGEVSDPTANRTMLAVDGPKIIIAVFQRDEYELPGDDMSIGEGPATLTRRYDSISSGDSGSYTPPSNPPDNPPYYPPDNPPDNPPPVPGVPEPATVLLLSLGTWLMSINRKK
ncbi:MAG: PEP-CTERM sorting domain-containing protein [Sedimentisphaerales bacterium]